MPLNCTKIGDDWLIDNGFFRLCFSQSQMGITSFAYLLGGDWHEVVNPSSSGLLYLPRLTSGDIPGSSITPYHGGSLTPLYIGSSFALLQIDGYLSNSTIGSGLTDFPFSTTYAVYEDGTVFIHTELTNGSGTDRMFEIEEHLLDPKSDPDITLEGNADPQLIFAGFYSNNTGSDPDDLSHDAILAQYGSDFDTYVTYTSIGCNSVGLALLGLFWPEGFVYERDFNLHLAVAGSPKDITTTANFQSTGDLIADDYRNPDPLSGGMDEGDVIIGSLLGGFHKLEGAYLVEAD